MSASVVLDRSASLELLKTVEFGRVAWADDAGKVVIIPVNFRVDGESVVFRSDEGGKVGAARQGRLLSFEADDAEPALRIGWSVLISGTAEVIPADEDEHLQTLGISPWDTSTPKAFFVRIRADQVSGRRLPLHPGGVTFVDSDPE